MAWFEGFSSSIKGQLTNLAKGVLNDEEGVNKENSNVTTHTDNSLGWSDNNRDESDWNEVCLSSENLTDEATLSVSSWHEDDDKLDNKSTVCDNVHSKVDGEVASIIPRGLANFFTSHVATPSSNDKCEKGVQTESELQAQIRALVETNRRLEQQNVSLTSEVASLARVVEDLESQVAVSQDENANLSTGLEELDIQHQQAIEHVLVVKDETQKQYQVLQTRFSELESNFEKEVKQRLAEKQPEMREEATMCDVTECRDVGTECENTTSKCDGIDLVKELEERDNELELVVCENERLREVVKELKDELEGQAASLPAIPENSEEIEALEIRVALLEKETSILREVRTNLETEVANSHTTIEDLTRRLQISDAMVRNQDTQFDEEKITAAVREQCEQELKTLREHCENAEASFRALELQSGDALARLRRDIADKDRRREELERDIERLQSDLAEERQQYSLQLDVENDALKKYENLQCQLQDMDINLDKLQQEIATKDQKICSIVFEANSVKEEFECYKKEIDAKFKNLSEENELLKEKLKDVDKQVCDDDVNIEESSRIVANLENEIKHQQEVHSQIETQLRLQIKEQELELHSRKITESKLKEDIETESNRCKNLQLKINELQLEIDELGSSNTKLQIDHEVEKEDLLKQVDSLKTVSNDFHVSKDIFTQKELEFKNQLQLKDEELTKLKVKIKENEVEAEGKVNQIKTILEERIVELEGESIKNELIVKELKDEVERGIIERTKLENTIKEIKQEYNAMKMDSVELQTKYDHLVSITDDSTAEAEQKIITLINEIEALKINLDTAEGRLKEAVDTNNYSVEMCDSVKEEFMKKLELERSEHQMELEANQHQIALLQQQIINKAQEFQEKLLSIETDNSEIKKNFELKLSECRNAQNEIERLNSVLIIEKTKQEKILKEKQQEINNENQMVLHLEDKLLQMEDILKSKNKETSMLLQEVDSLKNQLEYASQLLSVVDRQEAEGQPSADVNVQNQICPNGCKETQEEINRLSSTLLKEQTDNKLLRNQVEDLTEKVSKTTNQLTRLQAHLLSVEENYISELQNSQSRLSELQVKLIEAEDRVRNSSTAYTSANIRANQQVESLNQQLRLLTEHKEKIEVELSKAEDSMQRQNAAVTNLQAVLQQFQRDKQKDIDFETERLKQTLNIQCKKNEELMSEMKHIQGQLIETKRGLAAANRLTEQLDQKSDIIAAYKKQIDELVGRLKGEEEKVVALNSNVDGRVDRNLMKNLIVGYVCSPNNSKQQVLKVLAQVLDLNKDERQKVGLESVPSVQQQSLSEAFIRFLESESQPKQQIILPLTQPSTSAPPSRKTSQTGSILLTDAIPNLPHFTIGRSSGSILKDVLKERNT